MAKRNRKNNQKNSTVRKGDIIRNILAELPGFDAAANAAFDAGHVDVAMEYLAVIEFLEDTIAFLSECTQSEFADWLVDEGVRADAEYADMARAAIGEWIA